MFKKHFRRLDNKKMLARKVHILISFPTSIPMWRRAILMEVIRWTEVQNSLTEMTADIQRDYMLRRYQKFIKGQLPIEERVVDVITHFYIYLVTSWRNFLKRTLDLGVSGVMLVAGFPVIAAVAVAIRMDSKGPVFLKQQRVGAKGKAFWMYKFRSMKEDAEAKTGPVWAKEDDPRVTPVGRFLRKTHLDELPQLWNVLKGEMSIVGPRPERPHFVSQFRKQIPHYDRRHFAKPGITGLAQIKRRYDESLADVKKKVRYDVLYIKRMCPLLDLKVIALTALAVIFKTGR